MHHILHLVLQFLSSLGPIALAGTMGLPAFGGGETAAPLVGGDGNGETTTTESTETGQEGEEGLETTSTQEGKEGSQGLTLDEKVDWKAVDPKIVGHLKEIAKVDSALANKLQNAVYTSQSLFKTFPGGIKEAQALKTTIEDLGGIDEVRNTRENYQSFQDEQEALDSAARQGSPEALDKFISISGEGFGKMMPIALDKWAASDEAGYSHVMSKVIVSALREGNIVAELNSASKMLRLGTAESIKLAIDSFKAVADWANRMDTTSKTPPKKTEADPKILDQQKGIDQQNETLFRKEFGNTFGPWRDGQIRSQLTALAPKGREFNDFQIKTFGNQVVEKVKELLNVDQDYLKTLDRTYKAALASKDQTALLKLSRSRTLKVLEQASKEVYGKLFSQGPAKKKIAAAATGGGAGATGVVTPPVVVKGWTKVDATKAPKPEDIDGSKTPFEMKFRKQAILKNGQKVYWGDKVPV